MLRKIIFISMLVVSANAYSAEPPAPIRKPDFCKYIDKYNVEYKMPKDVEYDDGSSEIELPEEVKFPLNIDTAETFGIELPEGVTQDMNIGEIKIDKNGNVYFNNSPVDKEVKVKLEEACAK